MLRVGADMGRCSAATAPGGDAVFARIPRSEGGMPMFGAACQSELEMMVGPFGMAADAAKKRAKAATEHLQAFQRLANSGAHQDAAHMAWVLASRELAHATTTPSACRAPRWTPWRRR